MYDEGLPLKGSERLSASKPFNSSVKKAKKKDKAKLLYPF